MLTFTVVWHLEAAARFLQEIIDLSFLLLKQKSEMGFHVCEIPGKERSHGSCLSGKRRLSLFIFSFARIANTRCTERSWHHKDEWKSKTKKLCVLSRWCGNVSRSLAKVEESSRDCVRNATPPVTVRWDRARVEMATWCKSAGARGECFSIEA